MALVGLTYEFNYSIQIIGEGVVNFRILDEFTGDNLLVQNNVNVSDETITITYLFDGAQGFQIKPTLVVTTSSSGITSINSSLQLVKESDDGSTITQEIGNYNKVGGASVAIDDIAIFEQMPDMKVLDFLTSLFKMFNLTAELGEDTANGKEILLNPLDDFYAEGKNIDITKYVDIRDTDVNRFKPFSRIVYDFQEPVTFLTKERNNITNDIFGELELDLSQEVTNGRAYTGGDYETKVGFEHMLFERLRTSTDTATGIQYGRFVDDKQEPTIGKPLIFYAVSQSTASEIGNININGQTLQNYIKPSNVSPNDNQTINFGVEIDEWTLNLNQNSLFQNFHSSYIQRVFNVLSRIYITKALLPLDIILDYRLNDRFVINGRKFTINTIDININKREAKLELLNDF